MKQTFEWDGWADFTYDRDSPIRYPLSNLYR